MLKYWVEYNDTENVSHRIELHDDSFSGASTQLNGYAVLDMPEVENNLSVIRGMGLRVNLEASITNDLSDLYTKDQRTIKVIYIRDSQTKFIGWLNPEGYFENYVNDEWEISFDCLDGLGYLENLAFVDAVSNSNIQGLRTQLDIVASALSRIGLNQNINIDINTFYTGLSTSVNVLANVRANTDRYVKGNDNTRMTCKEVLEDVLYTYNAVIQQKDGEWFIFQPNSLFDNSTITCFRYDYLGTALNPTTQVYDLAFDLGSQIDGYYPHHSGENQQFTIYPSLAGIKIRYDYGITKSYYNNIYLKNISSVIDEWTINDNTYVTVINSTDGVLFDMRTYFVSHINMTSDTVNLNSGIKLKIILKYRPVQYYTYKFYQPIQLCVDDGTDIYYYDGANNVWVANDNTKRVYFSAKVKVNQTQFFSNPFDLFISELSTEATPVTGDISIKLLSPEADQGITPNSGDELKIHEIQIVNDGGNEDVLKGEEHTFQRSNNESVIIDDTIEVYTGDDPTDTYMGTTYKNDGITPTDTWFREGKTESYSLLNIMGRQMLNIRQSPVRIFTGQVYGYFDALSVVTINNRPGVYLVKSYSNDTKNNTIEIGLLQLYNNDLTDIIYTYKVDTGEEIIKPSLRY